MLQSAHHAMTRWQPDIKKPAASVTPPAKEYVDFESENLRFFDDYFFFALRCLATCAPRAVLPVCIKS
jgi:hypothetical protein